eukprot:gene19731-23469_t
MKINFFSSRIILLALCSGVLLPASAQNVPDLTKTAPAGSPATPQPPPQITVNPSGQLNYVRSFVPKVPISDANTLTTGSSSWDVQISTLYKDGFNRELQAVQKDFTPGNNLVTPVDSRFRPDQLGFLPYSTTFNGFRPNAFNEQQSFYQGMDPAEGAFAFSKDVNLSDAGSRKTGSYAPGKSQVGMGRGSETTQFASFYSDLYCWTLDVNGKPISNGFYPRGQLFATMVEFPGSSTGLPSRGVEYRDKEGKVILQQKADSSFTTPVADYTYLNTLYIYDELGQLRYIIPPKATDLAANGILSQTVLDELCFQYRYDDQGRKVEQKMPGKGWEYFIYDKRGRQVFYQDSMMRFQHRWAFSFYDALNRPTISGFGEWNVSREVFVGYMEGNSTFPANHWLYYAKNYDLMNAYPDTLPYCDILTYTYYDDYHLTDPNNQLWNTYNDTLQFSEVLGIPGAESPVPSTRIRGLVTGTRTRVLPSANADASKLGDWRSSVVYYDDKGRVIYTVSRDLYQGNVIHASFTGNQYRFAGGLLISKHIQANYKCVDGNLRQTELIKNEYADGGTGRLMTTYHKVNNSNWLKQASYVYDDLGRVKRKTLGNNGEVQDYSYNIRGQLSGINALYAET